MHEVINKNKNFKKEDIRSQVQSSQFRIFLLARSSGVATRENSLTEVILNR
jgi:hypothetical protein